MNREWSIAMVPSRRHVLLAHALRGSKGLKIRTKRDTFKVRGMKKGGCGGGNTTDCSC